MFNATTKGKQMEATKQPEEQKPLEQIGTQFQLHHSVVDVSYIAEYGLTQKLAQVIRCF
jgi:hypothetical protein